MALIDEVSVTLTSLPRLTLPPERWPAVAESVNRLDDAVWTGDEKILRAELKRLRGAVIGTTPRPQPGEGVAPTVNPLSYRTTDYATRTPLRSITVFLIASAVLLATLVVSLIVLLAVGDDSPSGSMTSGVTTSVEATPSADGRPEGQREPAEGGGGLQLAILGLIAVAGVGGFMVLIWRRRAKAAGTPAGSREPRTSTRLQTVAVPDDLRDAARRLVAELERRRG
ncbi:hypothetical protein A5727_14550 [Mycobacterium sp. ACS4331]|nr:hypothetical protein A5727_14550 [Mycobacterium sp. ACS4331]